MLGQNRIEKFDPETGDQLYVHEIFYTLQGEGPFVGHPAVFIRLAGCNLQCHWCDTEFDNHNKTSVDAIVKEVNRLAGRRHYDFQPIVVLTGGEPLRQNVVPLVQHLLGEDYHVQFETAGTLWPDAFDDFPDVYFYKAPFPVKAMCSIVCSPKTVSVHPRIAEEALAWKYVVRVGEIDPDDGLPNMATQTAAKGQVQRLFRPPLSRIRQIYVSPCWEGEGLENEAKTQENIRLATYIALQHGYRLSLQIHRLLHLP